MTSFPKRRVCAASNAKFRRLILSTAAPAALVCAVALSSTARAVEESAPSAAAQGGGEEITRLNEVGMELYKQRDYRRAVEKFLQAYAIDHDPNLLFNIARCYEQLGDSEAAIEKYEEFVKMPGADTQGRQRAHDALNQLRQLVAAAEGGSQPAPPNEEASAAPAQSESAPALQSPPASAEAESQGPGLLPWFLLGTGVVATGVGATVFMLGQADHDRVSEAPNYGQAGRVVNMTEAEARNWIEVGDQKKLYGVLGMGVGAALLATSAALFVFNSGSHEQVTDPQLAFVPGPDGAGVFAFGRF